MKVRCESCGKKFDYEQNDGLCPHCSVYNSPPAQAAQQDRQEWRRNVGRQKQAAASLWRDYERRQDQAENPAGYSEPSAESAGQSSQPSRAYTYTYQAASEPQVSVGRRRRTWLLPVAILAVGWAAAVGGVWVYRQQWMQYQTLHATPETVQLSAGESFSGHVYTLAADSAEVILPAGSSQMPQGWMAVGVNIQVAMGQQEWEDQAMVLPYVRLEDGRCLAAVDSYTLWQDSGSSFEQELYERLREQELWDLEYMYPGEESQGMLYYMVPDDTAVLTFCAEDRTADSGQLQAVGEWQLDVEEVEAP